MAAAPGYSRAPYYSSAVMDGCSKSLEDADLRAAEDVNRFLDRTIKLAQQGPGRPDGLPVIGKALSSYNLELNFAFLSSLDDAKKRFLNRSVLDEAILSTLERDGVVNWVTVISSGSPLQGPDQRVGKLVALHTKGDGNCLLHGLSLGMWGVDDKKLRLRTAIHKAVSDGVASDDLHKRWRRAMEIENKKTGCSLEESQWQREWVTEVVGLCEPIPKINGYAYDSLGAFHIFVAAQVLQRPIICFADETMPGAHGEFFAPVDLAGLYLPLLSQPEECVKSPLLIAFSGGHFAGLIRRNNSGLIPLCRRNRKRLPIKFLLEEEEGSEERLLDLYLLRSYTDMPDGQPGVDSGMATFRAMDVANVERVAPATHITQLTEAFVTRFDELYTSDLAARCRTPGCDCFHGDNDEFCSTCSRKRASQRSMTTQLPEAAPSEVTSSSLPPTAPDFPGGDGSVNRSPLMAMVYCNGPGCLRVADAQCDGQCRDCYEKKVAPLRATTSYSQRQVTSSTVASTVNPSVSRQSSGGSDGHDQQDVQNASNALLKCIERDCRRIGNVSLGGRCAQCYESLVGQNGRDQEDVQNAPNTLVKCIERGCRRIANVSLGGRCAQCYELLGSQDTRERHRRQRQGGSLKCKHPNCNHPSSGGSGFCTEHQDVSGDTQGNPTQTPAASGDRNDQSAPQRSNTSSSAHRCASPGCSRTDLSGYKGFCNQCMKEMTELWMNSRRSRHKWTCAKMGCPNLCDLPHNYCPTCIHEQLQQQQQQQPPQRKKCLAPSCTILLDGEMVRRYGGFCREHFTALGGETRCRTSGCSYFGTPTRSGYCSTCSEKHARQRISSQQQAAMRDVRLLSRHGEPDQDDLAMSVIPCVVCHRRIRGKPINGACRDCYELQPGAALRAQGTAHLLNRIPS